MHNNKNHKLKCYTKDILNNKTFYIPNKFLHLKNNNLIYKFRIKLCGTARL